MDGPAQRYWYRGKLVTVRSHADMAASFRPDGINARYVQRVIDCVEPWGVSHDHIEESRRIYDPRMRPFDLRVVEIGRREVRWAIHKGHKAKSPQVSPFVKLLPNEAIKTCWLTIEMVGTPEAPELIRVYTGGEYIPPLPWQRSAQESDGSIDPDCIDYWRTHAYVYQQSFTRGGVAFDDMSDTPPEWFLSDPQ